MKAFKFLPLVAVLSLAACGEKAPAAAEPSAPVSAPAAATAPAPVSATTASTSASAPAAAPVASADAPAAPAASTAKATTASAGDLATGEKVYTATCQACHGAGVMGAPKFGDKAGWGPRIAKGKEVLYASALKGLNVMPPKGGNAALKDEEVKAAVDYMISKSS